MLIRTASVMSVTTVVIFVFDQWWNGFSERVLSHHSRRRHVCEGDPARTQVPTPPDMVLTHTHTHTHTHTYTLSHTLTHTHTYTLSHTLTRYTLSLSHTHHTHTHTHTHTHSHTHTRTYTHTRTHTYTHTHTHVCFLWTVGTFHRLLLLLYWPNNIFYPLTAYPNPKP